MNSELEIKEEVQVEGIDFNETSLQCCLLCPDIKKLLKSLANHFKKFHYEDYEKLLNHSGIINFCNCEESVSLQFSLFSHLIYQIIPKISQNVLSDIHQDLTPQIKSENEEISESDDKKSKFSCKFCSKVLHTRSGLGKHINMMHRIENQFKCQLCEYGHCNTLKNLHKHMRSHEVLETDSKKCEKCNKKFQNEKQLYHHRLLHRQKLLECDFCPLKFNMKQPLLKHLHTHLNVKRPPCKSETKSLCEICSKWISSPRMKRHLGTHFHELRPANFKCDFEGCKKSFTELRNLQDHQNTHKNLKPYQCDFCQQTFRHRAALRQHRLRHIDPEKHKCAICRECFVTGQSLRKHLARQHKDEALDSRPFACDAEGCNSTFKYEDFLMRHKKDVHGPKQLIEPQNCQHCNYVAHNMKNYFQHMRRSHNIRKRLNNRVFPTAKL